jgi:hypothetical protein
MVARLLSFGAILWYHRIISAEAHMKHIQFREYEGQ